MTDLGPLLPRGGTESTRRSPTLETREFGVTTDERVAYQGDGASRGGLPVRDLFGVPLTGVDQRRLWQFHAWAGGSTFTDQASTVQDVSGARMGARFNQGTDPFVSGVIRAGELADGGEVVARTIGRFTVGSPSPMILARCSLGGTYLDPQYEVDSGTGPAVDLGTLQGGFEWSTPTIGPGALSGYDAMNVGRSNATEGEFEWELTTRIVSLGRNAQWHDFDDDNSNTDATCAVEMTLRWGALHLNAGGRQQYTPFGYHAPFASNHRNYNLVSNGGTTRGLFFTAWNQQFLCFAGSSTTALTGSSPTYTTNRNTATDMLVEEAPGIGLHWREFYIPAVQEATFVAYGNVDWMAEQEVVLELGGPFQADMGTTYPAYSGSVVYLPDYDGNPGSSALGPVRVSSVDYVARRKIDGAANSYDSMVAGNQTGSHTVSPPDDRFWRVLPSTRRDEMIAQMSTAYLFGGRPGVSQRRPR